RPSYSVYNIAFQNGFKRCSEEVQHFLQNGCDNFPEDSLLKPLMKHLNQKLEASSSNTRVPADLAQLGSTKNPVTQLEVSGNSTDYHSKISMEVFSPNSNKSDYSSMDSFSRVSRPSSDDSTGYHPNMNNEVLNSNSNKSDYLSADSCSHPSVYDGTSYYPKTTKRLLNSNCNKLDYSSRDSGSSASRPSSEYVTGYHPMKKRVLSSNSNTLNYPLMDYGSRASRPSSEDESPPFHNLVSEISIRNKEINFGPKMVAQNEDLKENMISIVQDVGDEDGIENVINSVLNTIIQCIPTDIAQWDRLSVSDQPNVSENSTDYYSIINNEVLSTKSNKSDYSSVDSRLCPPFSSIYNNLESDSSIRNKEINF
ncbi:hypothetical protein NPIL_9741, partial [Nephila pilipes]